MPLHMALLYQRRIFLQEERLWGGQRTARLDLIHQNHTNSRLYIHGILCSDDGSSCISCIPLHIESAPSDAARRHLVRETELDFTRLRPPRPQTGDRMHHMLRRIQSRRQGCTAQM